MTRLRVEADGGSRGNPGVAGYGALVRDDATGALLAERAAPLGKASNNVAEYTGLVEGLRAALDLADASVVTHPLQVEVRMDSKLVVEQMSGRWQIKHPDMRTLAREARELAARVRAGGGEVTYTWVPRASNAAADALSNVGMDGQRVHRDHPVGRSEGSQADRVADNGGTATAPDEVSPDLTFSASAEPDLAGGVQLILVRHGVSDFTVDGRLDGRGGSNPPLNAEGRGQAAAVAAALSRELRDSGDVRVVTSSLARAAETGDAIAAALGLAAQEVIRDADLDEQAFGIWDSRTYADISREAPSRLWRWREDPTFAVPGGESHEQHAARVQSALQRALNLGSSTVVIVSHRKTIMAVLQWALRMEYATLWRLQTAPGSVTRLEVWRDGGIAVHSLNETTHLR